ncbi:hypothetical protein BRC81_02780 [Halobacteriales archaeon QS_1_68_20]|nr:MAG: hypothetical protein BRC81_02780 [Halobacteriales archaeon QS_1_68_20]
MVRVEPGGESLVLRERRRRELTNATETNLERSGWYKHLSARSILKENGTYRLWFRKYYQWSDCSGWGGYTNYATSPDGVNWTDHGRVFDERDYANVLKRSDDRYWMYVRTSGDGNCDRRWWRYESSDGESWSNEQELTLDGERCGTTTGRHRCDSATCT